MTYDELICSNDELVQGWVKNLFTKLKDNMLGKWIFNWTWDFTDPDSFVKCLERLLSLIQTCNYFSPFTYLVQLEDLLQRVLQDKDLFNLFFWALKNAYNMYNANKEGVLFESVECEACCDTCCNPAGSDLCLINILSSELIKTKTVHDQ